MNKHGYRDAINKLKGLSAPHVKLTLAELAKYHALGHALVKGMGWKAANEKYPVSATKCIIAMHSINSFQFCLGSDARLHLRGAAEGGERVL